MSYHHTANRRFSAVFRTLISELAKNPGEDSEKFYFLFAREGNLE